LKNFDGYNAGESLEGPRSIKLISQGGTRGGRGKHKGRGRGGEREVFFNSGKIDFLFRKERIGSKKPKNLNDPDGKDERRVLQKR